MDAIVPIRVSGAESRALSRWSRLQSRAITTFRARMAAVDLSRPVLVAAPIVADAVLKKLAIRDRVLLDATGDILQPIDAVEALALGADLVSAGRGWMGMGLGCAKVKACAEGSCPYGIASKMDTTVGLSFDANKVAPKGYAAAANWHKVYAQTLAESGLTDWTQARRTLGLDSRTGRIRIKDGAKTVPLDRFYDPRYVTDLLRGALTRREVDRLVFGR